MELDAEAPRNNQFQLGNERLKRRLSHLGLNHSPASRVKKSRGIYLKRFSFGRAVLCVSHCASNLQGRGVRVPPPKAKSRERDLEETKVRS